MRAEADTFNSNCVRPWGTSAEKDEGFSMKQSDDRPSMSNADPNLADTSRSGTDRLAAMAALPGLRGTLARLWIQQRNLILYAFIGGSAVVVDLGIFTFLHEVLDWGALTANAVSVPVSVVWSFALNATLNFKTTDVILARLASFSIVSGIGFAASQGIIWAAEGAGASGLVAKLLSLPLVFVLQYILNSRLTFREQKLKGNTNPTDTNSNDLEIGATK